MVEQLLNADDDWIEPLRRWLYPKIHPHLKKLVVSSEDGEVESGGVSSETISTELVNGDDERHTGSYTATVSIDNSTKEVDIVDGVGELQITTDKNVNAVVNVRAIELNDSKAVSSDEIRVDVI